MYTNFFGLRENPFALPPDPRYLYLSLRHQEALAHLLYGIAQGAGFVQLTGEVGTGKTMMIRSMLERLPGETQVALVLYPLLSVEEFVAAICDDLRIPRTADQQTLKGSIDALNRFLLENHARGCRTVLIIDEAHKLSHDVLEQVRLLTNLETTKEKLLQILLVGQPELIALLQQPDLRQLAQRVTARYNLRALLPRETAEYVVHRLRVAGTKNVVFTRGALALVHRLANGTPRLVNAVCDRSLLGAYARGKNQITAWVVRQAAAEIGYTAPWRFPSRAVLSAAAALLLAVGGWQVMAHLSPSISAATDPVAVASTMPATAPVKTPTKPALRQSSVPAQSKTPELGQLLEDTTLPTDTDSAFAALFARWGKDYQQLDGKTGCERAQRAGLRCVFTSGTWNNLRQLNRPAVIELIDVHGDKHHVLVSGLTDKNVVLEFGGQKHTYPLVEVERFWYGKFLSLWMPPPSGEATLHIGMNGPAVAWLRNALARYNGNAASVSAKTVFDVELEDQVKDFQRRHFLEDDGVVGRSTLIHLDAYDASAPPPLLSKTTTDSGTP
ncbi:MAG: AAA family ATPase [Gammaproteobacteria bacterium]|nr:AAA family ATPase [Gammaproteobacteria bacterium]